MTGHTGEVSSVAFSPDGKTVASGSNDDTVRLWDTASPTRRGAYKAGPSLSDNIPPF